MRKRNYFLIGVLMIAATLAATLLMYPILPGTVPTHWNIHGQADGFSSKWTMLVLMPGIMAAIMGLFAALPWLSPWQFEVDKFRSTYLYMMLVILAFFGFVQALTLWAAAGRRLDMNHAVAGGVCLLLVLLGGVLGRVKRNFYVGVRTPWTIANERVWEATHRLAAKTFVAGGLLALVLMLLRMPFWAFIGVVLGAALTPAVYSLVFYKQLEHRGNL